MITICKCLRNQKYTIWVNRFKRRSIEDRFFCRSELKKLSLYFFLINLLWIQSLYSAETITPEKKEVKERLEKLRNFRDQVRENAFVNTLKLCEGFREEYYYGPIPSLEKSLEKIKKEEGRVDYIPSSNAEREYLTKYPVRFDEALILNLPEDLKSKTYMGYLFSKASREEAFIESYLQPIQDIYGAYFGKKNDYNKLYGVREDQFSYYFGSLYLDFLLESNGFYRASLLCIGKDQTTDFRADKMLAFRNYVYLQEIKASLVGLTPAILLGEVALSFVQRSLISPVSDFLRKKFTKYSVWAIKSVVGAFVFYYSYTELGKRMNNYLKYRKKAERLSKGPESLIEILEKNRSKQQIVLYWAIDRATDLQIEIWDHEEYVSGLSGEMREEAIVQHNQMVETMLDYIDEKIISRSDSLKNYCEGLDRDFRSALFHGDPELVNIVNAIDYANIVLTTWVHFNPDDKRTESLDLCTKSRDLFDLVDSAEAM